MLKFQYLSTGLVNYQLLVYMTNLLLPVNNKLEWQGYRAQRCHATTQQHVTYRHIYACVGVTFMTFSKQIVSLSEVAKKN